jgi:hypothetical protein
MTGNRKPSATQGRAGSGTSNPANSGPRPRKAQPAAPRHQAAAQRALAAERGRRRQWLLVGSAIGVVIVVVFVFLVVKFCIMLASAPRKPSS